MNRSKLFIDRPICAGVIAVDEILGLLKLPRLAPLAVGLGIYLPMSTTLTVVVGAVAGGRDDRPGCTSAPAAARSCNVRDLFIILI